MRGHIRKVAERRELRRMRREYDAYHPRPYKSAPGMRFCATRVFPAQYNLVGGVTIPTFNNELLKNYNLVFRILSERHRWLYSYKILYSLDTYMLQRTVQTVRNAKSRNRKWVGHHSTNYYGRTEPFWKYTVRGIYFINRLYIDDYHSYFKLITRSHMFNRTLVRYGKQFDTFKDSRRFFYLWNKLHVYKKLLPTEINRTFLYIAAIYGQYTRHVTRLRTQNWSARLRRTRLRVTTPTYKRVNYFTRRLLRFKYHGIHTYIFWWTRALRYSHHMKLHFKLSTQAEPVMFYPTSTIPHTYYGTMLRDNIHETWPEAFTFIRTMRCKHIHICSANNLQLLHDFVFFDQEINQNLVEYWETSQKSLDKHLWEYFKNLRKKFTPQLYNYLPLGYIDGHYMELTDYTEERPDITLLSQLDAAECNNQLLVRTCLMQLLYIKLQRRTIRVWFISFKNAVDAPTMFYLDIPEDEFYKQYATKVERPE